MTAAYVHSGPRPLQCVRCHVSYVLPAGWDRCPLCAHVLTERGSGLGSGAAGAGQDEAVAVPAVLPEEFECLVCGNMVGSGDRRCCRCGTMFTQPSGAASSSGQRLLESLTLGDERPVLVEVWEDVGDTLVCIVRCPICTQKVSCGSASCSRCGTLLVQFDPRQRDLALPLVAPP